MKLDKYAFAVNPVTVIQYLRKLAHLGTETVMDIKISFDGSAKDFVHAAVTVLNSVLPTQSRDTVIPILLYKGRETAELLEKYLKPTLLKLAELTKDKYRKFMVNDFKAFTYVCDIWHSLLFCPYCETERDKRHHFENVWKKRKIEWKWGLTGFKIIICVLHCKMRIIENLIMNWLQTISNAIDYDEQVQELTKRIRKIPGCSQFEFRTEKRDQEDDDPDQVNLKTPYLNGSQAEQILIKFEQIWTGILDILQIVIWKLAHVVLLCYVCASTEHLQEKEFNLMTYRKILLAWGRVLQIRYPASKFAFYIHVVIVHSADLLEKYKCLVKFSNEAVESLHCLIDQQRDRGTSDGGKAKTTFVGQVLGYALR